MHALVLTTFVGLLVSCCCFRGSCRGIVISSSQSQTLAFPADETAGDAHALLSFKSSVSRDPLHALSSWNETLHYCQWPGITCGGRRHPQRVRALDLSSLGLAGPLSPSLANLTFLRRLHLARNQFHGSIPPELGSMFRLLYLNLSRNSLQGEIPASLGGCSRLRVLSLIDNMLHGEIPTNLSRCSELRVMHLGDNMLSGSVPAEISSLLKRLVSLHLPSNNLAGFIPPSLGNLSSLAVVDLAQNNFAGPIPAELGRLLQLQYLGLSTNLLHGSIPANLSRCAKLWYLDLGKNNLTGGLPAELGTLPVLRVLYIDQSNLSGVVPPSLGNLTSAFAIDISGNHLEGSIPAELGKATTLGYLRLGFNKLTGKVPSSLYNLSMLSSLQLGDNQLIGTLSPHLGRMFPNLRELLLYSNHLEGPIPLSLPNASRLETLDLGENRFSGHVPSNLGGLQYLNMLNLETNRLEARGGDGWGFLTSLANCTHLEWLGLHENRLTGVLPPSIGNLSSTLEQLSMARNQIFGGIPQEITKLENLSVLYMYENLFTGVIPGSVGRLSQLQYLDLSNNMLSGEIPSSIGNLTRLNRLHLRNNNMEGQVPSSIRNCLQLAYLFLSINALNGPFPVEVLNITTLVKLGLSYNSFHGTIPTEVGNLKNLVGLYMAENKLSGQIPGSLSQCQVLGSLYMEGNFFQGTISEPLKGLRGLTELDLSRNNLSGPIPGFLETFPFLQYLNLSFNNFVGDVPKEGIFRNISAFSIIGNNELCGGNSKLHLQACPTQASRKRRQHDDLKVILIPCISTFLFVVCCFVIYCCWIKKQRNKSMAPSGSVGDQLLRVSYAELLKATDGFSPANLIGVGSFGSVYKGILGSDQKAVAVKVLNLQREGALKSFIYECEVLRNIRHHNLVKILTACSSIDFQGNEFKALVYEFMPNGSIEQWLHSQASEHPPSRNLSLIQRLNVAIDVASALEYLHDHHGQAAIIHCDLKPGNILLDDDMIAHVGDFGISRFLPGHAPESLQLPSSTIGIKGSFGYIAPEYAMGNPVSTQGDAYSFGILLLEMFTGRKPTDDLPQGAISLHKYVEDHLPEEVTHIIDLQLLSQEEHHEGTSHRAQNSWHASERFLDCMVSIMRVGLSCSEELPRERMKIKDVGKELLLIKDTYLGVGFNAML